MLHFKNASLFRNILRPVQVRYMSTIPVHLNDQINNDLEKEIYKPKDHPGRSVLRGSGVEIPERIRDAIKYCVNDKQIPQLVEDGAKLDRYLFARHVPLEEKDIFYKKKEIEKGVLLKAGVRHVSELNSENITQAKEMMKQEVMREYYHKNYNWQPIAYDSYKAWTYLFGRCTKEYAAIMQVFNEIVKRDPDFKPQSFFDFGAGVGTGTWAASELWKKSLYEYFLVDECGDMNDLSELILRGGNEDKNMSLKNVFYRQFLPASDEFKSHLILSAFTLNELPNMKARLDTLSTLWKKCDGYMVIIENGTNAGFQLVEEARELLIQQAKGDGSYLFAPCPHESSCPRMLKGDGTPCNFYANYRSLDIGQNTRDETILFSYVIFKKGSRADDKTINWPRMVRQTQVRSKHTRCKFCTHRGKLEEVVITKGKHSKYTYRCARKSKWGDRMPIEFEENEYNSADESDYTDSEKS